MRQTTPYTLATIALFTTAMIAFTLMRRRAEEERSALIIDKVFAEMDSVIGGVQPRTGQPLLITARNETTTVINNYRFYFSVAREELKEEGATYENEEECYRVALSETCVYALFYLSAKRSLEDAGWTILEQENLVVPRQQVFSSQQELRELIKQREDVEEWNRRVQRAIVRHLRKKGIRCNLSPLEKRTTQKET